MRRVALVGGGGLVGSRIVEASVLRRGSPSLEFLPVIRQHRSLARMARLGETPYRVASTEDEDSLVRAFEGCEAVVNLTVGDNARLLTDLRNIHAACLRSGVRILVHLSSAEVFGRCDIPNLSDDSEPLRDHWMPYARAKIRAEDWLRQVANPRLTVVTLRPGLIWGPTSPWVVGPASSIMDGTAYCIDDGRWACNLCFIDNVVGSIEAVLKNHNPQAGFYNIGDPDRPTWAKYLSALAQALMLDPATIAKVPESPFRPSASDWISLLKETDAVALLKRSLSDDAKRRVKRGLSAVSSALARLRVGSTDGNPHVRPTRALWWLQTTRYHLPTTKFDVAFPIQSPVTFTEGMSRTSAWLRHAGYDARGVGALVN
jgi:nucleoside-diphosphate-sugar epimerase